MQKYLNVVQSSAGQILVGVTVTVTKVSDSSLASLFSDNGITPKSNPFQNDIDGSFEFYVTNGRYNIVLSKIGYTFDPASTADILFFDPIISDTFNNPAYLDSLTGTQGLGGPQFVSISNSAGNGSIELGKLAATSAPFFDWHSNVVQKDYDVRMIVSGGTSNIGEGLLTMYAGAFVFGINVSGTGPVSTLSLGSVGNALNGLQIISRETGVGVQLSAIGEANVNINYNSKGAGNHAFFTDSGTNVQFAINRIPSTINYMTVQGSATSPAAPSIGCNGPDANIGINYITKGSGNHYFYCDGGVTNGFAINRVANAVNYIIVQGTSSGQQRAIVSVQGTDTDINIDIIPQGAGQVRTPASIVVLNNTAIPAGGTSGSGIKVSSTSNFGVFFGSGAPALSAAKGSLYLRSDGSSTSTRMYVNTDGGTTWTAVTTVA